MNTPERALLTRSVTELQTFILADPRCRRLAELAGEQPVALVGGWVRDWLLGRESSDWDLVTVGDSLPLTRAIAEAERGPVVTLDAHFGIYRTRLRGGQELDLARAVGPDFATDLGRRDLTVNALAVTLQEGVLHDPLNGLADLAAGIVRAPSRANLQDDPLRLLRIHRFAASLGFVIDADTHAWEAELVGELARSAGERILAELGKLLGTGRAAPEISAMQKSGLLSAALPGATQAPLGALEARRSTLSPVLQTWLAARVYGERTRWAVLLLGALLRGASPDAAAERLRWSRAEDKVIRLLAGQPAPTDATPRALHRTLKAAGDAAPGLALILGDDALLAEFERRLITPLPRLVTGDTLMQVLGLKPGPHIATLLAEVEEAQALGEVTSPAEALAWAGNRVD